MINYLTEIMSYANDKGISIDDVDPFKFSVSFALFCKECERCIIITTYPDIDENPNNYNSDDNLRYVYIVICRDCAINIFHGDQWKINATLLSNSTAYRLVAKLAKATLFDTNSNPILKISAALRSDSVYSHVMHIKNNICLNTYTVREISDSHNPIIMSSDGNGFF